MPSLLRNIETNIDVSIEDMLDCFDELTYEDQVDFFGEMDKRFNANRAWRDHLTYWMQGRKSEDNARQLFKTLGEVAGLVEPEDVP